MDIKRYDRISAVVLLVATIACAAIAITLWDWFPTPGNWNDIAHIPRTVVSCTALLLPPVLLLAYLLVRRVRYGLK